MIGRCVYTCLFGNYETLLEQPTAATSSWDYICFTDDPSLVSESWRIVPVIPVLPEDLPRSSRHPKILPHVYLDGFELSLYVDNSVLLLQRPEEIATYADTLGGGALAMSAHSFRNSIWEEAVMVTQQGLDDPNRVGEFIHAMLYGQSSLDSRPWWGGMILRQHHDTAVRRAMEAWWMLVLRYSRRDQLSLSHAVQTSGLTILDLKLANHRSIFHEWPRSEGRRRTEYIRAATESVRSITLSALREAVDTRARATRLNAEIHDAQAMYAQQEAFLRVLQGKLVAVEESLDVASRHNDQLQLVLDEVMRSRSWRLTAPMRRRGRARKETPPL